MPPSSPEMQQHRKGDPMFKPHKFNFLDSRNTETTTISTKPPKLRRPVAAHIAARLQAKHPSRSEQSIPTEAKAIATGQKRNI
jgi:hypothetical protein